MKLFETDIKLEKGGYRLRVNDGNLARQWHYFKGKPDSIGCMGEQLYMDEPCWTVKP